jgi:hypothetical protein
VVRAFRDARQAATGGPPPPRAKRGHGGLRPG